jgi:hypothetical protein
VSTSSVDTSALELGASFNASECWVDSNSEDDTMPGVRLTCKSRYLSTVENVEKEVEEQEGEEVFGAKLPNNPKHVS